MYLKVSLCYKDINENKQLINILNSRIFVSYDKNIFFFVSYIKIEGNKYLLVLYTCIYRDLK